MSDWKDKPDEVGDWLWVRMMECKCCIDCCGIAYVFQSDKPEHQNWKNYYNMDDFIISWEGTRPPFKYNEPMIHKWMKIQLPEDL